jgi:hypothetical protein
MNKIVNYKVLFEVWGAKLAPDEVEETLISTARALQVGAKCIVSKKLLKIRFSKHIIGKSWSRIEPTLTTVCVPDMS